MKISVLVPAYNAAKYIKKCVLSICNQTYKNLQIIVVDDGSADDTLQILRELEKTDSRIEIHTRANKGVAHTRNELISFATGDFILFIDSDDWIEPEMIETLLQLIQISDAQIAMCRFITDSNGNSSTPDKSPINHEILDKNTFLQKFMIHRELTGSLCNKLIKSELYKKTCFNTKISYGEDALVIWDILKMTDKMVVTKKQYYHYLMNDASISHQIFSKTKMSAVDVWNHISQDKFTEEIGLKTFARARFGAEVTLLLLNAAKNNISKHNPDIKLLRKLLKGLYWDMLNCKHLSLKFLVFSKVLTINWEMGKMISKYI